MSEERLSKMEDQLGSMTDMITVLATAVNKLTANNILEKVPVDEEVEGEKRPFHRDFDNQIKVDISDFYGSLNPDDLLDWLRTVERVFEYKGYDDTKMFKVAILKRKGYASLWYEEIKQSRAKARKEPIKSWEKLRKKMLDKFVSSDYTQELFLKLTHLKQDDGSVEKYLREFEQLTLQCEIQEKPEQKIARFLEGLDTKIADKVSLQPLWSFDEVVRVSQKIEKQSKGRIFATKTTAKPVFTKPFSSLRSEGFNRMGSREEK